MPDFSPIEIDVMRALSARDTRWVDFDRVCRSAGWNPCDQHDRTRVLAALSYLRRAGYVAWCRPQLRDRPVFALTERGAAELAGRDQLRLTA